MKLFCVIIARDAIEYVSADHYDAFDEAGRKLFSTYSYRNLVDYVRGQGYTTVPLNSRCGRAITDKLENQGKS